MKFLCLAYGEEEDWNALSPERQKELLAQDEVLRQRGDTVAAVSLQVTTVRAPDGTLQVSSAPYALPRTPLAGFAILEAADIDEAVRLVTGTPCVQAGGRVELRPITAINPRPAR